ncbi:type II toxin-antitoxin system Phd/YefM family antitoxin [Demequina soli]|uniref:type II toxin-antitoxin system Phd/YefM family antitoxin n=1 Tax=Demequina soli TaxID=1638987 RepID=UPI000781C6E1|nr:type II toxin-antitoxin system Phd/YefM family antitoxin [Demequina soli]
MNAISAREFNQNPSAAMRAADSGGPVIITNRGRAAYVLLAYDEFASHTRGKSLARALSTDSDIDFDPPRAALEARPVDL